MEFCFYLEKYWSGQNLTNRTICYGFDWMSSFSVFWWQLSMAIQKGSSTPSSLSWFSMVNPQSAMIEISCLLSTVFRNPPTHVSSISDIPPTYTAEIKLTTPLGVQAIMNFAVLWCLQLLYVDDWMYKLFGVSINISLLAKIVGYLSWNDWGRVPETCWGRWSPVSFL